MTKTAFLFSGQGAQYFGMGRDLAEKYPIVDQTFNEASEILGIDMKKLCFEENEQLNLTQYTQPAILTVSVAILRLLSEYQIHPDAVMGLSLGEYSALVASEVLDFPTALKIVAKRGLYMTQAAPTGTGKMVAIMNAPIETIEECCQKASHLGVVAPANYNTPNQIVIGGEVDAVDEAVTLLHRAGVKRMIELNVSGPFHTALLRPAGRNLHDLFQTVAFHTPKIPVISNTAAKVMPKEEIAHLLELQVQSPVRFYESIATLQSMGITKMIEVGPGKVLSGFIKKIDKSIQMFRVENEETLQVLLAEKGK